MLEKTRCPEWESDPRLTDFMTGTLLLSYRGNYSGMGRVWILITEFEYWFSLRYTRVSLSDDEPSCSKCVVYIVFLLFLLFLIILNYWQFEFCHINGKMTQGKYPATSVRTNNTLLRCCASTVETRDSCIVSNDPMSHGVSKRVQLS